MDFFVYYKVRAENVDNLLPRVSALLSEAFQVFAVKTRLMRRPEEEGGIQTWMEIYHEVPGDFDIWLRSHCETHDVSPFTDGQRHVERFVPVAH